MRKRKSAMQEAAERVELNQFTLNTSDVLEKVGDLRLAGVEFDLAVRIMSDGLLTPGRGWIETAERTGYSEVVKSVENEVREIDAGPDIRAEPGHLVTDAFPQCKRASTINELRICLKQQYGFGDIEERYGYVVDALARIAGEVLIDRLDMSTELEF